MCSSSVTESVARWVRILHLIPLGSLHKFIIYPLVYVIIYFKNNIKINNDDKSFQNIYNGELHNQKFCLASATCHYACTGTL